VVIRKLVRSAVPLSRMGVALWAWRNRDEVLRWAGFVGGAVPKLVDGNASDVLAEARLRARLTADARTRGIAGLRLVVADGVATVAGVVDPAVHDVARSRTTSTSGIRKVRDELQHPARRPKFAFS
jgi:hypothetical protein